MYTSCYLLPNLKNRTFGITKFRDQIRATIRVQETKWDSRHRCNYGTAVAAYRVHIIYCASVQSSKKGASPQNYKPECIMDPGCKCTEIQTIKYACNNYALNIDEICSKKSIFF